MMRVLVLAFLFVLLKPTAALAQDDPLAHVNCAPSSSGIAFGTFSGSQVTVNGSVSLHCIGTGNVNYEVRLSHGGSGSYALRTMTSGADNLSYNLYLDPAFTEIFGDGTGGSNASTGKIKLQGNGAITVVVTMYARLPAQTSPSDGVYTDTIVVTLDVDGTITTTSFTVTVNIRPTCTISATNLAFGSYSGAKLDSKSQISLTCTNGLPWNVGLNAGDSPGATVTTRKMTGPGNASIAYSLYRDPSHTLNWGNSVGSDTLAGAGTGVVQTIDVYGEVPSGQVADVGGYHDLIVATVTF